MRGIREKEEIKLFSPPFDLQLFVPHHFAQLSVSSSSSSFYYVLVFFLPVLPTVLLNPPLGVAGVGAWEFDYSLIY